MINITKNIIIKTTKPNISKNKFLELIDSIHNYQPIPEILFKDKETIKYLNWRNCQTSRNCYDRNKLINFQDKRVLDIGCNTGFYAWVNNNKFKSYVGIDYDKKCIEITKLILKKTYFQNIDFISNDIVDYFDKIKIDYDICLFFSIYHHMMYELGIDKSREIVNHISKKCKVMYFDMGQKNESTNYDRKQWYDLLPDNISPETYIKEEIINNTMYNNAEIVGKTQIGNSERLLFKFSK